MNRSGKFIRLFSMLALVLTSLLSACEAVAETTPEQVKEFVSRIYIEGVPYEEASQLAPDVALPVLEQVLNDPRQDEFWANAAVTIGMIGHRKGSDLLIKFITRKEEKSKLNRSQTVAKTSAVMALGYIVNKSGDRKALAFLKSGVDPGVWHKRNLGWTGEFHGNGIERDKQLAMMAVLGLGISGNREAAQTLRLLKEAPKTTQMRAIKKALPNVDKVAGEALQANTAISGEGLKNYYRRTIPKTDHEEGRAQTETGPEVVKPPVPGEVLKKSQPGEVLKKPQPGEVVTPSKEGEVLRPSQPGEIIK